MPFIFRRLGAHGEPEFLRFYVKPTTGERTTRVVQDVRDASRFPGDAPAAHKGKMDTNWRPMPVAGGRWA